VDDKEELKRAEQQLMQMESPFGFLNTLQEIAI